MTQAEAFWDLLPCEQVYVCGTWRACVTVGKGRLRGAAGSGLVIMVK
jgi:hypothetical protein